MIKNNHQSSKSVFSRQARTSFVQLFPTSGFRPSASGKPTPGTPRMRPHDPKADIQGYPAPSPADRRGESAHIHHRPAPNIRHRTDTNTNTHPPGPPPVIGIKRQNKEVTQTSEKLTENRTPHVVRQDKRRSTTARTASPQPAADTNCIRARLPYNGGVRSQSSNTKDQKNGRITLWGVDPLLKAELERIALRDGISLSAAGVAYLRRALRQDIDLQYTATLEPIIERILAKYLNHRDSRVISLLVRIAFDSGQTRSIVTNILGLQPDITPELLREIIEESDKRAKTNITRKTPQITSLMEALEQWFFQTNREETKIS
jgi:hypothetical protein